MAVFLFLNALAIRAILNERRYYVSRNKTVEYVGGLAFFGSGCLGAGL
jgi:hypothetical protein